MNSSNYSPNKLPKSFSAKTDFNPYSNFTPTHILCHYSEIGLKGDNRSYFEKKLKLNIQTQLKIACPGSIESLKRLRGRFLLTLSESGQKNIESVVTTLSNVFGLAYFAPTLEVKSDYGSILESSVEMMSKLDFTSFRVTARNSSSPLHFGAQKMNEDVGAAIVIRLDKKVSLNFPDVTCYIDMLQTGTFIYPKRYPGQGGLPVGVSSKVIVMLSGGIDSPVAAYYAMKRGANPIYVHFHSVPHVSPASIEKVKDTVKVLSKYQPGAKLYSVEFAPIQDEIYSKSNPKLLVILYRRYMIRIAELVAKNENAQVIYTGEALGQVASQTIENISVVEDASSLPIFRPLIGFDKEEIIAMARKIGTYDISIRPHQDCCTLFVPKHPATKAYLPAVLTAEDILDTDELVQDAVKSSTVDHY